MRRAVQLHFMLSIALSCKRLEPEAHTGRTAGETFSECRLEAVICSGRTILCVGGEKQYATDLPQHSVYLSRFLLAHLALSRNCVTLRESN